MKSIHYLSLFILVVLASCTTNATVVVHTKSDSSNVDSDTAAEKTSPIVEEEMTPVNPVEQPVSPSVHDEPPAEAVDEKEPLNTDSDEKMTQIESDIQMRSKSDVWQHQIGSKFLVFTCALPLGSGRSFQTEKFAPLPCQIPIFELICV